MELNEIDVDRVESLERPLGKNENEVQEVLGIFDDEKGSGLDGFNLRFTMRCWDFLQADFMLAVSELHNKGISLTWRLGILSSHKPKSGGPNEMSHNKPINLAGCI